jgi:two-component system, chemotaxis family, protein-glutamate methylesterase/glutaminase
MIDKAINVLIVDDSRVFRHVVEDALCNEPGIAIIGSVRNGVRAMEAIAARQPDLVTLDIEMPDMDGLETLQAIKRFNTEHPLIADIGAIMLSAHTKKGAESTIRALEAGAFDFVTKPSGDSETENIAALNRSLVPRIHHFASLRMLNKQPIRENRVPPIRENSLAGAESVAAVQSSASIRAIAIGVSTGGPRALSDMLPTLSENVELPIFIVQHMPEKFTQSLAESLDKKCHHRVKEGEDGEVIDSSTIYIAPGGRHLLLRQSSSGPIITITDQPPENGCRPSVDVLFRSLPAVYGGNVVAVILTGMGNDGSGGLRAIKRAGARTIAQDEATSVVWGMPGSAVETGLIDQVIPLMQIPAKIKEMLVQK